MNMRSLRTALAAAAIVTMVAAGCGDDDDEASEDTTTTEVGEGDADGASGSDVGVYCDASFAIETAPEPDVDFQTASPEEIAAALKVYAADTMKPLVEDALAVIPAEIADDAERMSGFLDELASTGDPGLFEQPEFLAASQGVHQFDLANCGWNEQAVQASDYSFANVPDELPAGPTSFELSNEGDEFHELLLFRKNAGVTQSAEELLALPEEAAMTKVTMLGSPALAPPGNGDYKVVDLEAGEYIAVCFIPMGMTSLEQEPSADAAPHFTQGMVAEFSVN